VLFVVLTLLALYSAALTFFSKDPSPLTIVSALALVETCAKQAMLTLITFGRSSHEGMGSQFIARTSAWSFPIGIGITGGGAATLGAAGGIALLISLGATFLILAVATRSFGGVGGDVMGAANEITRALSLLTVATVWTLL
jgi:adenosylcobinamide-GDP ribazoletransferase